MTGDPETQPLEQSSQSRHAGVKWVLSSAGFSLLGDQFQSLALSWVVLAVTGSAAGLGMVLASGTIPRAALMLIGGIASDKIGPRRVLMLAALGRTIAVPAMILSLGSQQLWAVCVAEGCLGAIGAFYYPADASMMPKLDIRGTLLQRANASLQVIMQTANTAGPAVAGLVVAWAGGRTSLMMAAAAYAIAGAVLLLVRRTGQNATATQNPDKDSTDAHGHRTPRILGGFSDVVRNRALSALLMTVAAVNLCTTGLFSVGLPAFARGSLQEPASVYGLASFSFAGGSLVGAFVLKLARIRRTGIVILVCVVALLVMLGSVSIVARSWQLVVALSVAGVFSGIANVLLVTQLQSVAPREAIGRVMSVVMLASLGTAPVAQILGGYLAAEIGVRLMFALLAGAGLGVCAISGRNIVTFDQNESAQCM